MKKNKNKKGFTLIELVIVLAVLAIIALIAIPNFTRVRNDSLKSADDRSKEQIEDIIEMGIANKYLKQGTVEVRPGATHVVSGSAVSTTATGPGGETAQTILDDLAAKVEKPQVRGRVGYDFTINSNNEITFVDFATGTP